MKYYLYLDESGGFNGTAMRPSIVAGYLIPKQEMKDEAALKLLEKVKYGNNKYKKIDIKPFHGMEEKDPARNEFMLEVLEQLIKKNSGTRLVKFSSQRQFYVVSRDITYLNVFAEGVVNLINELLSETEEDINLSIFYARSVAVNKREHERDNKIIPATDYRERIEERIKLRMVKYSRQTNLRIRYEIKEGSARKDNALILADIVNFSLRGGYSSLCREERERLRKLSCIELIGQEDDSWLVVKKYLLEYRLATALYAWYVEYGDELKSHYEDKFYALLAKRMRELSFTEKKAQYQTISQIIHRLLGNGSYGIVEQFTRGIVQGYIPYAKENGFYDVYLDLDIHFFKFTNCSRQGKLIQAERERVICKDLFTQVNSTFENLDYYIRFRLREAQYLNNCFDFDGKLEILKDLERIMTETLEVLKLVDGLGKYSEHVRSSDLCHIYNSMLNTFYYLPTSEENRANAELAYNLAKEQSANAADMERIYLNYALIKSMYGEYDKAIHYLAISMDIVVASVDELGALIDKFKRDPQRCRFLIKALVCVLVDAGKEKPEFATKLYDALNSSGLLQDIDKYKDYAMYAIKLKIGQYLANRKDSKAKKFYEVAIEGFGSPEDSLAAYVIGLAARAEKIYSLGFIEKNSKKMFKEFYKALEKVRVDGKIQESTKVITQGLKDLDSVVRDYEIEPSDKNREIMKSCIAKFPIL